MGYNGVLPVLELTEDYETLVTYLYSKTELVEGLLGSISVNAEKSTPIAEYSLSVDCFENYDYLKNFFESLQGSTGIFCYLDPVDHYAHNIPVDTQLGAFTQGVVVNINNKYYLSKKYWLQTASGDKVVTRIINRPKENDITIYNLNNNPISVTVDWDSGEITSGGENAVTWSGFFYVPVRFQTDLLPNSVISFSTDKKNKDYSCENILLKEVKETLIAGVSVLSPEYQHEWQLRFENGYSTDFTAKTNIITDGADLEKRTPVGANLREFSFPDLEISSYLEKEYLITLWRICLGNYSSFVLNDTDGTGFNTTVYFSDTFGIKPQAYWSEFHQYFIITGLKFKQYGLKIATTYCHCWLITRRDGVQHAFTNHDTYLEINGITYSPKGSYLPSSPSRTSEIDNVETVELSSYLLDITESDIINGKFKDADVIIFYYDWYNNNNIGRLFTGNIKSHAIDYLVSGANSYTFNVKSALENFNVDFKVETSSSCRVKFLSTDCGRAIDASVRKTRTIVNLGVNVNILTIIVDGTATDYDRGLLTFTSGELIGITIPIVKVVNNTEIQMLYKPPILPEIGDNVEITKYCGKTAKDCKAFGNIANFRGEPRIPGLDKVRNTPAIS